MDGASTPTEPVAQNPAIPPAFRVLYLMPPSLMDWLLDELALFMLEVGRRRGARRVIWGCTGSASGKQRGRCTRFHQSTRCLGSGSV